MGEVHRVHQPDKRRAPDVLGATSEDLFDLLRLEGKRMRFLPCEEAEEGFDPDAPHLTSLLREEPDRGRGLYLQTRPGPEALERRLLTLHRDARTAEEEQGANILYLAVGLASS